MRVVNLTLPCPQSFFDAITADPQPDWTPNQLFSELYTLEQKFYKPPSLSPLPLTQPTSRFPNTNRGKQDQKGKPDTSALTQGRTEAGTSSIQTKKPSDKRARRAKRKCETPESNARKQSGAFVMRISDNDIEEIENKEEEEEVHDRSLVVGRRYLTCVELHRRAILGEGNLKMVSGAYYIPKPKKLSRIGDDAHFICDEKRTVGVADGVGGWAKKGIDAGVYARKLMANSLRVTQNQPRGAVDLKKVLSEAYLNTTAEGSSTACIITLAGHCLSAVNVGDSGFAVFRGGKVLWRSPIHQHEFNYPFQLGNHETSDRPNSAQRLKVTVQAGDVMVAGTDGLFDNMSLNEIGNVVNKRMERGAEPRQVAKAIARHAKKISKDQSADTPMSKEARRAGFKRKGGKPDDITVVVSYIL